MAERPTFDEFFLALLHPHERARLGIVLHDDQAKLLVQDRVRAVSYYSGWTPDFSKQKKRRRSRGLRSGRRAVLGWLMFAVTVAAAAAIAYWTGRGFLDAMQDDGSIVYQIAAWLVETTDRVTESLADLIPS